MKIVHRALLFFVLILISLLLVACGGKEPVDEPTPEPDPLTLLSQGKWSYTVIRPEEASVTVVKAANHLQEKLTDHFGAWLKLDSDWVRKGEQVPTDRLEILIGSTNRPESIRAMAELGDAGYAIRVMDKKVVLVAADDVLLLRAIQRFLSDCLPSEVSSFTLPGDLHLTGNTDAEQPTDNGDGTLTLDLKHFALIYNDQSPYLFLPKVAKVFADKAAECFGLMPISEDASVYPFEILFGPCARDGWGGMDREHLFRDFSLVYREGRLSVEAVSIYGYERAMRYLLAVEDGMLTIPKQGYFSAYDYGTGSYAELRRMMENPYAAGNRVLTMSHRGNVTGGLPENSIASYQSCLDAGVEIIETDLQYTKDGKWVICHDGTLDRTTSSTGAVGDRTQAQLMALRLREGNGGADVALTDQHLPSLEQVIALCKGKALFNLDKVPPVRFDLVYQAFAEADALEMAMFKGRDFSAEQMTDWCCRLMKEDKELPLFSPLRYSETEQGLKDFRGLSCMMETGQGHSKEIMALAKEVGIGMLTMTALNPSIDKESTWDKLKQDGYSTIMTDEPIRMKEWVEKD